jgi:hypothetical protein
MACIALITGTAYLIEVDKAEARVIWSTKELSLTTSYNATYINTKKAALNRYILDIVL